jgi:hypothetical protein
VPGRLLLIAGAGVAAIALTVALSLPRNESPTRPLSLAPLSVLGRLRQAAPPGAPGPEAVPIPAAPSLAAPRSLHVGERIDGIACESGEQVAFHIHARLRIVVAGRSRRVPAAIGIAPPHRVVATRSGRFVAAGSCFMWLHTHAADGIVHIESPADRTYTLGDFFDIWGQALTRRRVGPARGRVTALIDGRVFTRSPRAIPLLAHSQIELEVGRPLVAPEHIAFPGGL